MEKIRILFFGVLLFFSLSCQQKPIQIFISPLGDNNADGTKENPVMTITKAKQLASDFFGKREVNIIFDDGIYYLFKPIVFTNDHSGAENYPVVYRAANEGKAIISGGARLNLQWEYYENGIFKAQVSDDIIIDQLYINGQRQRMARFPNAVDDKNVFDSWELIHTKKPDAANDPLDPERIDSWSNPTGAYVHAMHYYLWGDMHWLVKGKNEDGTLNLDGGWQNNRPSQMHPRYRIIENLMEELDSPGEWFYNKQERILFYYPETETDLQNAQVEIVRLKNLIEFNGTKETPVKFIHIDGLVFRHSARTFMENKEQLLRSDWTTYRGGAVFVNGAEDIRIENCEFDQLGGNSIFVNNYNRRITVKSCYIHNSGANGVAFVGDPATVRSPLFRYGKQDYTNIDLTPGPIGDNYPQDCLLEDCLITMTGRDEKQTAAVQISMSHKITVRHCSIYDVPRAGINISEGTFGGHVIEHCDVFNTVLETGDHGSFNSWGRDRFWTPDIKETAVQVEKMESLPKLDMLDKNIIRNSRWRCDHGWDIDLDDGSSWYEIYNNVLLNGGLKMREGYKRKATNNVIINNSLHPHVWYPESGDVFTNNIVFSAYKPAAMNRGMPVDAKWGSLLDSNFFVTNRKNMEKYRINGCDYNSVLGNPDFINPVEGDYRVKKNSSVFEIGFKNFPMDNFGVVSEKLKAIAKTPELPTIIYNIDDSLGVSYQWLGATVKSVETQGEQSAAGLPSISGVILLEIPEYTVVAQAGFKVGDVMIECEGNEIKNFAELKSILKSKSPNKTLAFKFIRNQVVEEINFKMDME